MATDLDRDDALVVLRNTGDLSSREPRAVPLVNTVAAALDAADAELDLVGAGIAANEAASLDDALGVVAESFVSLTGADGATVAVWDEGGQRATIRAGAGASRQFVGSTVGLGGNVAARAAAARRPVVLYGEPTEGLTGALAEAAAALACSIGVPLELEGGALLTLQAGWEAAPGEREVERATMLLRTLAELAGLARRAGYERARERDLALLEAMLESVPDGICVYTSDRRLANGAARLLLAVDDPDFSPTDLVVRELDGSEIPSERQPGALARRTGRPQRFRNLATRLDGAERVFDGVAAPVLSPGGDGLGVVFTFRDVTEEHSSEVLREQLLQRLFESLPTGVALFDAGTRELRTANRAFLDLVGLESEQVVGQRPLYPWWDASQELPAGPEDADTVELVYRRGDAFVPVEVTRRVLRSERGEALAVVVLATDRSERRRFEQQLVQAGKLAAVGELAAGVAHEINNPLFAILGLVEFLLKDAEPESKAAERLRLIQETGLEIKEIVRALLDFARERTDEVLPISLEDVAAQTLELVRRTSSAKRIELVERYCADDTTVEGSASQLKQVLLNLVTNAQQAMPDGGTITVEVTTEGRWASVTVTDTGPGLEPDVAARAFDPFFTTKRELGGTGLGLSVSAGIARAHGGGVSVVSEPGRGASFTLRLPLVEAGAA